MLPVILPEVKNLVLERSRLGAIECRLVVFCEIQIVHVLELAYLEQRD